MGGVLHLFGEKVAGINNAGNVSNFDCAVLMLFTDAALVEVDVFGAFEGDGGGPVDGGLVIVVDGDGFGGVGHAEVKGAMFNGQEIVDALVCGVDFSDARAACCLILPDCFPCDGTTCATDKITGEGSIFKEFKGGAIGHCVTELATPACVTVGREFVAVGRSRGNCVRVGFLVVVMGEVVEGLNIWVGEGVEANTVVGSAVEVFEDM